MFVNRAMSGALLVLFAWLSLLGSTEGIPTNLTVPGHRHAKRLENEYVFGTGHFNTAASGNPLLGLYNGVYIYFQDSDANVVVRVNGNPVWSCEKLSPASCDSNTCEFIFQDDGNLVTYFNGRPLWYTGTTSAMANGPGHWLVFYDEAPYIVIYNAANQPIWYTNQGSPPATNGGGAGGSPQPSGPGNYYVSVNGQSEDDDSGNDVS